MQESTTAPPEIHPALRGSGRERAEIAAAAAALAQESTGKRPPRASKVWKPETHRRPHPKVGRNAPCPCGSGLKFKRCHLRRSA